ncbi:glycosyltransferase family 39 protein, partial [bacterium]|nr:glycosyltransferase family 39 protein [bacterium]
MSSEGSAKAIPVRWVLGGALIVAVVLRLEYLRELAASPFGEHLLLDATWYDQAARRLLDGVPLAKGAAYFRPPLYPMFVAALYALFDGSIWSVRATQWALGVVHVALCWGVARRTHGDRAAAVTAVLAAAYGMFIYFEGEILTTALGVVATTAGALLLLEGKHRSSLLLLFAGGLALGTAAILHGTALVLAPVAVLWAFGMRRRALAAIAVTLGLCVPVGAVTARNYRVSGEFVPVASQGGINFYIGNNEHADGKSALAPGFAEAGQVIGGEDYRDSVEIAAQTLAEREAGRELTAGEVNRFWFAKGAAWMRDHPKDALALFGRKLLFFWNGYEISNNRDLRDQAARFTPLLGLFLSQWAFLVPFGLLGVGLSLYRRRGGLLLGFLLVYTLAIAAFFVCSRYRQPAVAWTLPFAAAGILWTWDALRTFRVHRRRAGFTAGALLALFLFTNGRFVDAVGLGDVTAATDAPFHRFNLAVLFEREGDLDRAIDEYRAAAEGEVRD